MVEPADWDDELGALADRLLPSPDLVPAKGPAKRTVADVNERSARELGPRTYQLTRSTDRSHTHEHGPQRLSPPGPGSGDLGGDLRRAPTHARASSCAVRPRARRSSSATPRCTASARAWSSSAGCRAAGARPTTCCAGRRRGADPRLVRQGVIGRDVGPSAMAALTNAPHRGGGPHPAGTRCAPAAASQRPKPCSSTPGDAVDHVADLGDELVDVERLLQVAVAAQGIGPDGEIGGTAADRADDDRQLGGGRVGADGAQAPPTRTRRASRRSRMARSGASCTSREQRDGLWSVVGQHHVVARQRQHRVEQQPDVLVVLDDENRAPRSRHRQARRVSCPGRFAPRRSSPARSRGRCAQRQPAKRRRVAERRSPFRQERRHPTLRPVPRIGPPGGRREARAARQ